eukprot:gb/GFBE01018080.1/.p1 GENE.gb/GFBE01018080.1/~~gb/GFBE01018080.1/.p1  ORF type:complete len:185 (+),score=27.55 gb/GFBE01018080.1/:1-555(+)
MARASYLVLLALAAFWRAQAYVAPRGRCSPATPSPAAAPSWPVPPRDAEKRPLAVGVAIGLFAALLVCRPAAVVAADLANGEAVFDSKCVSCHAGGGNKIYPMQNLSKQALQQNGKYDVEQIMRQVTYGQVPMPAFAGTLAAKDIEDVASFVYAEADANWRDKRLVGGQARRFSQFLDSLSPFQ